MFFRSTKAVIVALLHVSKDKKQIKKSSVPTKTPASYNSVIKGGPYFNFSLKDRINTRRGTQQVTFRITKEVYTFKKKKKKKPKSVRCLQMDIAQE